MVEMEQLLGDLADILIKIYESDLKRDYLQPCLKDLNYIFGMYEWNSKTLPDDAVKAEELQHSIQNISYLHIGPEDYDWNTWRENNRYLYYLICGRLLEVKNDVIFKNLDGKALTGRSLRKDVNVKKDTENKIDYILKTSGSGSYQLSDLTFFKKITVIIDSTEVISETVLRFLSFGQYNHIGEDHPREYYWTDHNIDINFILDPKVKLITGNVFPLLDERLNELHLKVNKIYFTPVKVDGKDVTPFQIPKDEVDYYKERLVPISQKED